MNKKISLGLAISLIAIASAVTFIITSFFSLQNFNNKVEDVNEKAKKYNSLQSLDSIVRENYYGDIDEEKLRTGILKGYVEGLSDESSRYLSAEEYEDEKMKNSGQMTGIGISVEENEKGLMIISDIIEDSPVAETNISTGDVITEIDGKSISETGFEAAERSLYGNNGTEVTLKVHHNGTDIQETFMRHSYDIKSAEGEVRGDGYGYIRISAFNENTYIQFLETLSLLNAQGVKGYIFDVRNNSGGVISSLQACLDPLLPEGVIVMADYGVDHSETMIYSDSSESELPMVVIVNENTAGMGELFAAAVRDFKGGSIVGSQTKGEGSVQEMMELEDGSAVLLTIGKYRTAKSDYFDGTGLNPDYVIKGSENDDIDQQYEMAEDVIVSKTL